MTTTTFSATLNIEITGSVAMKELQPKLELVDRKSGEVYCDEDFYEELIRFHENNFQLAYRQMSGNIIKSLRNNYRKKYF